VKIIWYNPEPVQWRYLQTTRREAPGTITVSSFGPSARIRGLTPI